MKRYILSSLILLGAVLFSACDKDRAGTCKSDIICYTEAPDKLYIKLNISPSPTPGIPVKVTFYKGNVDTGEMYETFYTNAKEEYYYFPTKEKYSAEAEYIVNGNTVVVTDGDYLSAKYCENDEHKCFDWDHELVLDLELKDVKPMK